MAASNSRCLSTSSRANISILWLAILLVVALPASWARDLEEKTLIYLSPSALEPWDGLCAQNNQSEPYRPPEGHTVVHGGLACVVVFLEGHYGQVDLEAGEGVLEMIPQFSGIINGLNLSLSYPTLPSNVSLSSYESSPAASTLDSSTIKVTLGNPASSPPQPAQLLLSNLTLADTTLKLVTASPSAKIALLISSLQASFRPASSGHKSLSTLERSDSIESLAYLVTTSPSKLDSSSTSSVTFSMHSSSLKGLNSRYGILQSTLAVSGFLIANSTIDTPQSIMDLPLNTSARIPIEIANSYLSKVVQLVTGTVPDDFDARRLANILTLRNSTISGYPLLDPAPSAPSCIDLEIYNSTIERMSINCNSLNDAPLKKTCRALVSGSLLRDNELCLVGTGLNVPHPTTPGYETQFTFVDSTVELSDAAQRNAKLSLQAATITTYNTRFYNTSRISYKNGSMLATAHGGFQYSGGVIFAPGSDLWTNAVNVSDGPLVVSDIKLTGYVHIGLLASIRARSGIGESPLFWKLRSPLHIVGVGSPVGFGSILDISYARIVLVPAALQNSALDEQPFIFFQNGASLYSYNMTENLLPSRLSVEWNTTMMDGMPRLGRKYVIGTTFFHPPPSADFGRLAVLLKDTNGSASIWTQYDVHNNVDRDDVYTLMLGNVESFKPFPPSPSYRSTQDSSCNTPMQADGWFCSYGSWIYPTELRLSAGQTLTIPEGIDWTYIGGDLIFDGGKLKLGSEVFIDGCLTASDPNSKVSIEWQIYTFPSTGPGYWYSPIVIFGSPSCKLSAKHVPVSVTVPGDMCKGANWVVSNDRSSSTALVLRFTLDKSQCNMLLGLGIGLGILVLALIVFVTFLVVRCIIRRRNQNAGYHMVTWEDSID